MNTSNGATNGVAKSGIKTAATTSAANGENLKVVASPSLPMASQEPPTKPTLQEIFKRNEEITRLGKIRAALVEKQDEANAFVSTENDPGEISFEDSDRHSFEVKNFVVIQRLLAMAKETLAAEIAKVDAHILSLF